ncbi:hypothetical protein HPB49_011737 [Dermacentor silvarum]|uniref:Uncharacterized protein n=1 Tax=Dermacentor silvarum TaxID=543639 RepID=A0ACB8DIR2_DERSI|nr:hypothetical protein HPB49_011737 [Dermacentor silvarum]
MDGDASSVDRLSDVPPPPAQSEVFYGDLSDMSQHSSSSYGYDQRPLLVTPLSGKYQATPLAHVMQGFARDYTTCSPEMPSYVYGAAEALWLRPTQARHRWPQWASLLAQDDRPEDAPTNFSSDSGMVADSEDYWGTSPTLPDLLHGPVESNPVVMAVLDGEKVVNHCAKPNNEDADELACKDLGKLSTNLRPETAILLLNVPFIGDNSKNVCVERGDLHNHYSLRAGFKPPRSLAGPCDTVFPLRGLEIQPVEFELSFSLNLTFHLATSVDDAIIHVI